jgi:hypothetical protein
LNLLIFTIYGTSKNQVYSKLDKDKDLRKMLEKDHPKYYKRIKKIGEQCDDSLPTENQQNKIKGNN